MTEVKRGRGRPPKARLEAEEYKLNQEEPVALDAVLEPAWEEPDAPVSPPPPETPTERTVEVEMIRKYVPCGQPQEIKKSVPAGSVIFLPEKEALNVLKLGIARATDKTFDR